MVLAIGIEQSDNDGEFRLIHGLTRLYDGVIEGFEAWRATSILTQIRQSEPKVYVDGQLVRGPLEYGPGGRMDVLVPGEGVYSIITYPGDLAGWVKVGRIHGSRVEFRAGSKQVRIECNQLIVASDRPVFALRRH